MQEELLLKNRQKVLVRDLQANDDVFALMKFINELVEEKSYLTIDELQTPESETGWLQSEIKKIEKGDTIDWRIWLDGKCVGGVSARRGLWKENGNVEFGIALLKEVRGQGLGRQLLEIMIAHVRKEWKYKNLYIRVYSENKKAHELYKSMGFKEFARFKNWLNHYGTYMDAIWLILI